MPPGCPERFSPSFLRWIWDWHRRHPHLAAEIARAVPGTPVVAVRTGRDADEFLARAESYLSAP